jgi:hypothetical protein
MSLLTYREPGKDGLFFADALTEGQPFRKELVNKDIVFVLDTSGSMNEEGKMEKARPALLFGVRTLRDGDRFNIINFAGEEHLMETGLIAANDSGKKRGEDFVEQIDRDRRHEHQRFARRRAQTIQSVAAPENARFYDRRFADRRRAKH